MVRRRKQYGTWEICYPFLDNAGIYVRMSTGTKVETRSLAAQTVTAVRLQVVTAEV